MEWVCRFLEQIPPHWVIQRLTGDPNPGDLVAPAWTLEKKDPGTDPGAVWRKQGDFRGQNTGGLESG